MDKDEGVCYRAKKGAGDNFSDLSGVKKGDHFAFREKFIQYANEHVIEPYRESFLKFIEPENIHAKLTEEIITAHRYLAVVEGLEYYEMLRVVNLHSAKGKDIHAVSVGFADVDSETRELMSKNIALTNALKKSAN